jgi:hypothetical protein
MEIKIEVNVLRNWLASLAFLEDLLFWSAAVTVDIKSVNMHHTHAVIPCKDGSVPHGYLLVFLGSPGERIVI